LVEIGASVLHETLNCNKAISAISVIKLTRRVYVNMVLKLCLHKL